MHEFKLLAATVLYSSLRVLYNQTSHKDIKIKNLDTFYIT